MNETAAKITDLLTAIERKEAHGSEELLTLVYDDLRHLAAAALARESPGQTLQATALVHEAWLRLGRPGPRQWEGQKHFFAAAARAMRRILIDNARRKQRLKRGSGQECIDINEIEVAEPLPSDDLLALDEALTLLAEHDAEAAELVHLRFFAGLTQQQAADLLSISRRTADRNWAYARAWLFKQITDRDRPTV